MYTFKTQKISKVKYFQGRNKPKTNIVPNTAVQRSVKECILEGKYPSF